MDYLFMVPFAGVTAFDRMARAAADMGERWHKFVSNLAQRFFPTSCPPAWFSTDSTRQQPGFKKVLFETRGGYASGAATHTSALARIPGVAYIERP